MLHQLPDKIKSTTTQLKKPSQGFSHFLHILLKALLPVMAYILVRIDFVWVAILMIALSKWRMFAVRPRYWLANIIANGIDLLVAVSFVLFMASATVVWWQIFWAISYAVWLIYLKPRSAVLSVSLQAMLGQLLILSALFLKFGDQSLVVLVAATWGITYLAARHYLTSYEEPQSALLAQVWAYFSASLVFVLGHWLLFYGSLSQITVILTTIGYGLAALYYLDATDRLTALMQRQLLGIMCAILLIIIVLSDWTGSTV